MAAKVTMTDQIRNLTHARKSPDSMKKNIITLLAAVGVSTFAAAASINYADWTAASPGSVTGNIGSIGLTYTGDLAGAQINNVGFNFWSFSSPAPYFNGAYNAYSGVANMPTTSDIVRLAAAVGPGNPNTVTFSQPVTDPIMLVLSMGQPGNYFVSYSFDQPFSILSSGTGYWGGSPLGSLTASGNTLTGLEGHGAIQFKGTFSSLSWTVDNAENWHGFTLGLTTPSGVPDGGASIAFVGAALAGLSLLRRRVA